MPGPAAEERKTFRGRGKGPLTYTRKTGDSCSVCVKITQNLKKVLHSGGFAGGKRGLSSGGRQKGPPPVGEVLWEQNKRRYHTLLPAAPAGKAAAFCGGRVNPRLNKGQLCIGAVWGVNGASPPAGGKKPSPGRGGLLEAEQAAISHAFAARRRSKSAADKRRCG